MFKLKRCKGNVKTVVLILVIILVFCRTILFNPNPANLDSSFDLILTPLLSASSPQFLMVFVISSSSNFLARDTIRKTWAMPKTEVNMRWIVLFVLGKPLDQRTQIKVQEEANQYKDILQGDFFDNKENLLLKTILALRWATYTDCEYFLKTDDDMYVHILRLTNWLNTRRNSTRWLYAGKERENGIVMRFRLKYYSVSYEEYSGAKYPHYCRGGFYLLSGDALPSLLDAQEKHRLFPVEDAYVGVLTKHIGLTPTNIYPRYLMLEGNIQWKDLDYSQCKYADVFAFGDNVHPSTMLHIHNSLPKLDEQQSGRFLCVEH